MQTLAKIMEQIEEATFQIDKNTATGSRLALILIDNALELTMWQTIKEMCTYRDPGEKIKSMEMYKFFPKKTQFLVSNYIITGETKTIFDECHKHRNEVYHQNISKESIINDLAKIYLEACCKVIFTVFDDSFCTITPMRPVPDILIRYNIVKNDKWVELNVLNDKSANPLNGRMCSQHQLFQTLESDINNRIEKVRSNFVDIDSFSTSNGNYEKEKFALNALSLRASKIKFSADIPNALTSYRTIDEKLIQIELSTEFGVYQAYCAEELEYECSIDACYEALQDEPSRDEQDGEA